MTVTPNVGYTSITIASAVIDAFVANQADPLELIVTYSCGNPTTIEVLIGDITIVGGGDDTISIIPSDIGQVDVFSDGVYRFHIRHLAPTVTEEVGLLYIGKDVACLLLSHYADNIDCVMSAPCEDNHMFWAAIFDNLLQRLDTCSDFTYEKACAVYEAMRSIIDNEFDCDCT